MRSDFTGIRPADVATDLIGTAHGRVLTGPEIDTHNSFDKPDAIKSAPFVAKQGQGRKLHFALPSKSVAVVAIE